MGTRRTAQSARGQWAWVDRGGWAQLRYACLLTGCSFWKLRCRWARWAGAPPKIQRLPSLASTSKWQPRQLISVTYYLLLRGRAIVLVRSSSCEVTRCTHRPNLHTSHALLISPMAGLRIMLLAPVIEPGLKLETARWGGKGTTTCLDARQARHGICHASR